MGRWIVGAFAAGALAALAACGGTGGATDADASVAAEAAGAPSAEVTVYASPTCGCCRSWVAHLEEHGYAVRTVLDNDIASVKRRLGVPEHLHSCHTATVGGYLVEGHVPASDLDRLLEQRPEGIRGIAVPGMPTGSPGMEVPGAPADPFDVVAFTSAGETRVFASYRR